MTQEEKDLLIKDLCARLPYGVKIDNMGMACILTSINNKYRIIVESDEVDKNSNFNLAKLDILEIEDAKPYLFPISSMTDEQYDELYNYCYEAEREASKFSNGGLKIIYNYELVKIDWLNQNHFDWRGLIPMGLAKDATGLNIY